MKSHHQVNRLSQRQPILPLELCLHHHRMPVSGPQRPCTTRPRPENPTLRTSEHFLDGKRFHHRQRLPLLSHARQSCPDLNSSDFALINLLTSAFNCCP